VATIAGLVDEDVLENLMRAAQGPLRGTFWGSSRHLGGRLGPTRATAEARRPRRAAMEAAVPARSELVLYSLELFFWDVSGPAVDLLSIFQQL
jgi:hypothetical protein